MCCFNKHVFIVPLLCAAMLKQQIWWTKHLTVETLHKVCSFVPTNDIKTSADGERFYLDHHCTSQLRLRLYSLIIKED